MVYVVAIRGIEGPENVNIFAFDKKSNRTKFISEIYGKHDGDTFDYAIGEFDDIDQAAEQLDVEYGKNDGVFDSFEGED